MPEQTLNLQKDMLRRFIPGLTLAFFCTVSPSCAVFFEENRRLTNLMDENFTPESETAQTALVPVAVPAGLLAILSDMIIVHPVSQVPEAVSDTYEFFWENPEGGPVRQAFLFIPKVVLTPVFFAGDWILRSLFGF